VAARVTHRQGPQAAGPRPVLPSCSLRGAARGPGPSGVPPTPGTNPVRATGLPPLMSRALTPRGQGVSHCVAPVPTPGAQPGVYTRRPTGRDSAFPSFLPPRTWARTREVRSPHVSGLHADAALIPHARRTPTRVRDAPSSVRPQTASSRADALRHRQYAHPPCRYTRVCASTPSRTCAPL
jgi:hypothetical protein